MDWICSGCGRHYSWAIPYCNFCIGIQTTAITTNNTLPINKIPYIVMILKSILNNYPINQNLIDAILTNFETQLKGTLK